MTKVSAKAFRSNIIYSLDQVSRKKKSNNKKKFAPKSFQAKKLRSKIFREAEFVNHNMFHTFNINIFLSLDQFPKKN